MLKHLIETPGFRYFTALLQEPYHSAKWLEENPNVRFWELENEVVEAIEGTGVTPLSVAFPNLLMPIYLVAHNPKQEHFMWFLEVLKDDHKLRLVAPTMLAYASYSGSLFVTVKDAAEMSKMSESPWRVRCQNGEIPGAVLLGGVWFIPKAHMIRLGLMD